MKLPVGRQAAQSLLAIVEGKSTAVDTIVLHAGEVTRQSCGRRHKKVPTQQVPVQVDRQLRELTGLLIINHKEHQ